MNRGERREINKRKWYNKLKSVFNAKVWDWYKLKGTGGSGTKLSQMIYPRTWTDMFKTQDGIAYKETGTIWHNMKTEKDDIKSLHKRDLANKSLSKEDKEEIEETLESLNNPYSFENYCGACDHFGKPDECPFFKKVHNHTEWKNIGCDNFWD